MNPNNIWYNIFSFDIMIISLYFMIFMIFVYIVKISDIKRRLKINVMKKEDVRKDAYNWMLIAIIIYIVSVGIYIFQIWYPGKGKILEDLYYGAFLSGHIMSIVFIQNSFFILYTFEYRPNIRDIFFKKEVFLIIIYGIIAIFLGILYGVYISQIQDGYAPPGLPILTYIGYCIFFIVYLWRKELMKIVFR